MPSLAFAAYYPGTDAVNDHEYVVNPDSATLWADVQAVLKTDDAKYVEVVKAPTHTEAGKVKIYCVEDFCKEPVERTINAATGHSGVQTDLSLEEYAAAMLAQKVTGFENKTKADKWVKDQKATNKCYVRNANVCSCGYVTPVDDANIQAHQFPAGAPTCTDRACVKCGTTVKGSRHVAATWDNSMKVAANKVSEPNCGHGTGYKVECTICHKNVAVAYDPSDAKTDMHNYGTPVSYEVATTQQQNGSYKVNDGYVGYGYVGHSWLTKIPGSAVTDPSNITKYKFYKYNDVKAASCAAVGDGTNGYAHLVCTVCGKKLDSADVTITPKHDLEKTHVAATCDKAGYTKTVCKNCGLEDEEPLTTPEPALKHSYKAVKTEATCKSGEYYTFVCTTCGENCTHKDGIKVEYNATAGKFVLNGCGFVNVQVNPVRSDDTTATFAFEGFTPNELNGAQVIEVVLPKKAAPTEHNYGAEVLIKAATCTTDALYGRKCVDCGKIDHTAVNKKDGTALKHDIVEIKIPATCGKSGSIAKSCTRCDYRETVEVDPAAKPVVGTGVACSFDKWVVTKGATVFEEGVKSLTCSVCGAVDAKTVIAKKTVAKASNTVKAGKKSFSVQSSAANATGYRVYYKKAGAKSWKSYTKKTDSLSKTFSKLSKGKYYVKVKAYAKNYAGDGEVVWGATSSTKTVKVK